jgi:uncharacterized membrane protein YkvA (DUF1232 family)
MLFRMVEDTCAKLDALDVQRDAPGMMRQIFAARPQRAPDLGDLAAFAPPGVPFEDLRAILTGAEKKVAVMMVTRVKESAAIARRMVTMIRGNEVSLHAQVGLVVVLLYFVDPHDLVPDSAEGGYGFIDDSVLLRAGLMELADELPADSSRRDKHGDDISMLASVLPPRVVPVLEKMVIELQGIVRTLRGHPVTLLSLLRDQIISTGVLANIPAVPRSAVSGASGFPSSAGRWERGVYFEGNNVIVPGGPSLIDGKLQP